MRGSNNGPVVDLIPVFHGHLTVDLPGWAMLWNAKGPLFALGAVGLALFNVKWFIAYLAVGGAIVFAAMQVLRRRGVLSARSAVTKELDNNAAHESSRLVCRGDPAELRRVAQLPVELFEPVVVDVCPLSAVWAEHLTALLAFGISITLKVLLNLEFGLTISYMTCMLLALTAVWYAWGRFYRVVPGRLDMLRSGLLGVAGTMSCNSLSLRGARIVCDYHAQTLEVTPCCTEACVDGGGDSDIPQACTTLRIDLTTLRHPHAFVEGVFRGALCERSAPSLPVDALIG